LQKDSRQVRQRFIPESQLYYGGLEKGFLLNFGGMGGWGKWRVYVLDETFCALVLVDHLVLD
jgi:hypothetical protein